MLYLLIAYNVIKEGYLGSMKYGREKDYPYIGDYSVVYNGKAV
jgi:hypothetical protein